MCAQSSSQWESVPVGSEDVTEAVDFWVVNTREAAAAGFSSSSSSPNDSLGESENDEVILNPETTELQNITQNIPCSIMV